MDRAGCRDQRRSLAPVIEVLESREVLSFFAPISSYSLFSTGTYSSSSQQLSARAAIVRHEYDQYVGEVKTLELKSQATPAEFLALRDDARAISAAASAADLPAAAANETAAEVSLQLDRAPLYGAAKDPGWALVSARVTTNLESLDVPQSLIDQTLADMKTLAASANVSASEFQTFTNDFNTLRAGEASLPSNPYYHFEDPGLFYSQHLRGFFRHWGTQKVAALATLKSDLRAISVVTQVGPAGVAVLNRDAQLLEGLGGAVPSATNAQLEGAYLAVFAEGVPTAAGISQLRTSLVTILGPVATAPRISAVDRLAADAPAFAQAAGESQTAIETIVTDVGAVVNAGGGETLNPFKVTVQKASPAKHAG
jgi:hypothetical protein